MIKDLLYEIKKLDDKQLLVEIQLVESQIYHGIKNIPKAKAALTSVKTASHSIYVIPELQAQIDLQSGVISAEENDFNTSFSYFFESFEGYNSLGHSQAGMALKYMLLSKIMDQKPVDALSTINSQTSVKYQLTDCCHRIELRRLILDRSL